MKRKQKRRKRKLKKQEQILRWIMAAVLILLTGLIGFTMWPEKTKQPEEVRAVWLAYVDYKELGLYNQKEKDFREHAEAFFRKAEDCSVNTVYFHVRAFRDAAYKSRSFPLSRYIWDRPEPIPYDPLKIMTELAHDHDMQIHAWLNPYRNRRIEQKILNPASEKSTEEILTCVDEILTEYPVDGIHFDDYFYKEDDALPAGQKAEYVNRMVRQVYKRVKDYDEDLLFGISPAGNIGYCESIGADVKTWMTKEGYVDYLVPQIYWTDRHSASWREKMFTETLQEWISFNKKKIPLYIGLALYRAGEKGSDDPGWEKADNNIALQIQELRKQDCGGFALFSAGDFYKRKAKKELKHYQEQVR